jgi:hypothetical protein
MTNLGMPVLIDHLVGLALRVFGTEGSIITRLFTILKKKTRTRTPKPGYLNLSNKTNPLVRFNL